MGVARYSRPLLSYPYGGDTPLVLSCGHLSLRTRLTRFSSTTLVQIFSFREACNGTVLNPTRTNPGCAVFVDPDLSFAGAQ